MKRSRFSHSGASASPGLMKLGWGLMLQNWEGRSCGHIRVQPLPRCGQVRRKQRIQHSSVFFFLSFDFLLVPPSGQIEMEAKDQADWVMQSKEKGRGREGWGIGLTGEENNWLSALPTSSSWRHASPIPCLKIMMLTESQFCGMLKKERKKIKDTFMLYAL